LYDPDNPLKQEIKPMKLLKSLPITVAEQPSRLFNLSGAERCGMKKNDVFLRGKAVDQVVHRITKKLWETMEPKLASIAPKTEMSFPILTFHHIGIACRSIASEEKYYKALGYSREGGSFSDPLQGISGVFMILEPATEASPVHSFLNRGSRCTNRAFFAPIWRAPLRSWYLMARHWWFPLFPPWRFKEGKCPS
jgi:hypothetical protein